MRIVSLMVIPGGEGWAMPDGAVEPKKDIHIALGGVAAEARYCDQTVGCPASCRPEGLHNYSNDNERAVRAAQALLGKTLASSKLKEEARQMVDGIVAEEWVRIEFLASALWGHSKPHLTSDEIEFLLNE